MTWRILAGDVRETLPTVESGTVQTCVTSPPYFGLRDYGHDGQIGLEQTPDAYVAELVAVFREVRRVLRDDGTVWLNLGDSYARSAGDDSKKNPMGINTGQRGVLQAGAIKSGNNRPPSGMKPKDLIGIPWRVAFALQADGWYLRQDIIWHKPNPMPESVTDRCTKAHEYVFLLAKSERYYFDAEAIAERSIEYVRTPDRQRVDPESRKGVSALLVDGVSQCGVSATRNKRSVWTVTTKPFADAHFATFPPDLIRPMIRAGSRPGDLVLDPFNGAGTTGLVATQEGRRYVGCELNPAYVEMAERRISGAVPLFGDLLAHEVAL